MISRYIFAYRNRSNSISIQYAHSAGRIISIKRRNAIQWGFLLLVCQGVIRLAITRENAFDSIIFLQFLIRTRYLHWLQSMEFKTIFSKIKIEIWIISIVSEINECHMLGNFSQNKRWCHFNFLYNFLFKFFSRAHTNLRSKYLKFLRKQ